MLTVFIETSRTLWNTQHPMQLVSEMLVCEARLSLVSLLRMRGITPPNLHTTSCIMLYHVQHKCYRVNKLRNMRINKHNKPRDRQQRDTFQPRSLTKRNLMEDLSQDGRLVLNWNISLDGAEWSIWFKIRDQGWAFMEKAMNIHVLVALANFSIWATTSFWRISPLFGIPP